MVTDFMDNDESVELGIITELKEIVPASLIDDRDMSDTDYILEMTGDLEFGCMYCANTGYLHNGDMCEEVECVKRRESALKETFVSNSRKNYPFRIPSVYRDREWDIEIALKSKPNFTSKYLTYDGYCKALDKILSRAINNTLLKERIIITSPPNTGKRLWAYTILKESHKNGITVNSVKTLEDITIDEAKNRQVLIIMATRYNFSENMDKLDHILYTRETLDLVTIVISDISQQYFISKLDGKHVFFNMAIEYGR